MRRSSTVQGFTLVELLIVVVILAILAALVIPSFQGMSDGARYAAFATELEILAEAANRYYLLNEQHLPDTASGAFPVQWTGYLRPGQYEDETPLGGAWDLELNSFGITSAVGAHFNAGLPDQADLIAIDELMDDGDIDTGTVRRLADNRYYYVLAE